VRCSVEIRRPRSTAFTNYAARWHQKGELFRKRQLWAPLPNASNIPGPPNCKIY